MHVTSKYTLYGMGAAAIALLLGFHAALEVAGSFWVVATYAIIFGAIGYAFADSSGACAQRTLPFWLGALAAALPLSYLMWAFAQEVHIALTIAWAVAILSALLLLWRGVWRKPTQQPTS